MKKIYNLNSHHKEGQEQSKKIYRSISDQGKRLDDARACANKILDLFKPSVQVLRSKLQEYCERLIFKEPLTFGLKAEEHLWRKCYYDVISTSKILRNKDYTIEEKSSLIAHINAGIGHYHHFISKLQTEYNVPLEGSVDFYLITSKSDANDKILEWASMSIHRSLIYLGDLCRYKLEIYPNWDPNLAIRYYSQALHLNPDNGMPHNQIGTLASSLNQHLDAIYHYIQCMMCKKSFEGTENNLHRLFEKNSQYLEQIPIENPEADCIIEIEPNERIKRFVARFLLLTDIWFFNKKISHIYDLCHQTNVELQECLSYSKPVPSESSGSQNGDQTDSDSVVTPAYLSADMIFKIVVICLLCITKLQKEKDSQHLSSIVAFTLAVYSQLIQHTLNHIQEGVLNSQIPEKNQKKKVLRRRKKFLRDSDEESDVSDIELSDSESEDESIPEVLESSSEEEEEDQVNNEEINKEDDLQSLAALLKRSKLIDVDMMIDIVKDESYMPSIKVLSDWLMNDLDVLHSCGKNTRSLFGQLCNLLNFINIDQKRIQSKLKLDFGKKENLNIALPEDLLLKGCNIKNAQSELRYGIVLSKNDEIFVRSMKLICFGEYLARHVETGVGYDAKSREFSVMIGSSENEQMDSPAIFDEMEMPDADANNAQCKQERETKGQLMKNMGQLWLAAEVKDLELRVKGKMSLSPYLVVDVEALIKHIYMVKQLVYSKKFIVLVPSAVLSALDDQKKEKPEAREAIRWLEKQFGQGNRFFRSQRPQEHRPIPFIKYPKKKDKDAFIYIQIIECCHYLVEQQKGATNLVTLLMGDVNALHNTENREISYVGLAQSAGVNLEVITDFYGKWKKGGKNKR
ncbi:PREDICTED: protein SMG5 [Nicrophorus vespilloides]|uniref:Protein SMG5 n=1 Tax=Nicrophorus vespilloides TaxID=110193 RepID=A0ABM1MTP4_NICVS|nr:PREDICTED: protein SMG5 [Nicrophorus vespilloides]